MRILSIIAFASLLIIGGAYYLLNVGLSKKTAQIPTPEVLDQQLDQKGSVLTSKRKHDLDQIGAVINEKTVRLDEETKEEIKTAKKDYAEKEDLKELLTMLEQSYLDRNSSMKDIKRIQSEIIDRKNKIKAEVTNTEKWDPKFVYYLMIQENYTYPEINMIKSLSENGLNTEEVEYINELIREDAFMDRIMTYKTQGDISRTVASLKKAPKKEVDDFIDDVSEGPSIEDKLIEMNYNKDE